MIAFLNLLIYLSIYMIASKQSFANSTLLELREVTLPQSPKITTAPTLQKKIVTPEEKISALYFSQPYISFGFLVPGEPLIRSDIIKTQTTYEKGATVFITQNQALTSQDKNTIIPDTTCDTGSCSPSLASVWESPLTFGFGVRCENTSCMSDFEQDQTYRPISASGAYPIFTTHNQTTETTMYYKLNIASNQNPTPYSNTVTYILIPNL